MVPTSTGKIEKHFPVRERSGNFEHVHWKSSGILRLFSVIFNGTVFRTSFQFPGPIVSRGHTSK